ncbi:MAG: APC family permease [Armatimonadetes bacterium]|nr:APC family permease [Armatimonadota bacterium]
MYAFLRRLVFGTPFPTSRVKHERLSPLLGYPVFGADPISSSAYATEEILLTLMAAGSLALSLCLPITIGIVLVLVTVIISYRQTIYAYPGGGGAYTVAKENLGTTCGLVAAASLLVDYVLTCAVSVSAGVAAIISAFPTLSTHRVGLCVLFIIIINLINLRGVRESGMTFALPTYLYVGSLTTLIAVGLWKHLVLGIPPPDLSHPVTATHALTLWLILRAFSGGCVAMTGTEAVSNGVPMFKPPESKKAAKTLGWMGATLTFFFLGLSILAHMYHVVPVPDGDETVVSQIARGTFGTSWFYFLIQVTTAALLIMAANTAYSAFPLLSSILARDGVLPRQLSHLGDRLVFSNGIVILGILSIILVVIFGGSTHALIPLYAVGVFISFTLSQGGMVRRMALQKKKGWLFGCLLSGIGCCATGVVSVVIAATKFSHGAWIVVVVIPLTVYSFWRIKEHYVELARTLRLEEHSPRVAAHHTVVVLVPNLHRGILAALDYARSIGTDVRALHIETEPERTENLIKGWEKWAEEIPLVILESPYRSIVGPVLDYLEEAKHERDGEHFTVVIPEFVPKDWWEHILHNQMGLLLKLSLLFRRDMVVTNVRYYTME